MNKGRLYGVGVGPGDPGLMTLRGAEVIRACPVVAVQMAMGMRFHPKHCRMKSLQG